MILFIRVRFIEDTCNYLIEKKNQIVTECFLSYMMLN